MKKIVVSYVVQAESEIEIADKWQPYIEAWQTSEDDRTEEQWDLAEDPSFHTMLAEALRGKADADDNIYEIKIEDLQMEERNLRLARV